MLLLCCYYVVEMLLLLLCCYHVILLLLLYSRYVFVLVLAIVAFFDIVDIFPLHIIVVS